MKRALAACLLYIVVLTCAFSYAFANEEENLLLNGGFENVNVAGEPEGWYAKAYRTQAGYSRVSVTSEKAHSGQYSAVIENSSSNDARFICTVTVEPESLYRMSGYILVESMEDIGNGANFGIEDIYSFSDRLFDTNGEWQYIEWYGETGQDQTSLTFGVRIGGYSAESVGKAFFDDIRLEKVEELPQHVVAAIWYQVPQAASSISTQSETGEKSTGLFVVLGLVYLVFLFVVLPQLQRKEKRNVKIALTLLMLIALSVRIVMAMRIPGYQVDIGCFTAWSLRMAELGPVHFYSPDYFCDYPPGAMLLLWPVGKLLEAMGANSLLIVKLLPILFDLLGAWLLYRIAQKHIRKIPALILYALYLFNPAVLVNGAAWGQVDSVLAFFMLLTADCAMQRKWHKAIPLFIVSALIKPQALLFAPIGGMWLLFGLRHTESQMRKQEGKHILVGLGYAASAALAIILPFAIGQENLFGWLIDLYSQTLSSYSYATLNTANLYYLIGANWTALEQSVPGILTGLTALVFIAVGTLLSTSRTKQMIHCKEQKTQKLAIAMLLLSVGFVLLWIFDSTYAWYGYLMMAAVYLVVILCQERDSRREMLPFHMALALIGVYVLGVKVHERYLFPALLLLLLSYVLLRDRRILWLFAGFSVTTFINTAIVLDNSILFGAAQGHLNQDTALVNTVLCIANLGLCGFGFWLSISGLRRSEPLIKAEPQEEEKCSTGYRRMLIEPRDSKLHLTLRDWIIMTVTAAAYAVLAFSNLGSTVAPQTGWISTSAEEQIVLDLGVEAEFSVLYYAGVSYNNFSVSVSSDGETWSGDYPCQMREGLCYQWRYAVKSTSDPGGSVQFTTDAAQNILWLKGRYLRVNACEAGLNLWEVVARDRNGKTLPLTVLSQQGGKPELLDEPRPADNLVDESATCIGEPGWYNSMYFDEIYHAREAYHNLHGEPTYEWTHPPLGKLLMAASVAVFGMTPFGWRFAGAFMGVLMLPALYLLSLQLTKKRTIATVSMVAFALDLMHFTQTRIATIDSFPLLFILLSYLCMVRYMQTDVLAVGENTTPSLFSRAFVCSLIPLFLCGIFMGLSIASKWTGAYSAVGLAVLFFLTVIRQERAAEMSYDLELNDVTLTAQQKSRIRNAQQFTLKRIVITCCFCVIFFVLIPIVIYVVSYIPQMTPNGPFTLERVIRTQQNMLDYHSTPGLGMDHPFQSPWWQWPFLLKPMWYVQDQFEPAGYASTIMCFGNPWVFFIGAFAMLGVLIACVGKYLSIHKGIRLRKGDGDLTLVMISVAFLAQYLPWILVPRSMYIYHYFASVPFIILSTALLLDRIPRNRPRLRYTVIGCYILGAAVFFAMFFPYASGNLTSTQWLDALKGFFRLYY